MTTKAIYTEFDIEDVSVHSNQQRMDSLLSAQAQRQMDDRLSCKLEQNFDITLISLNPRRNGTSMFANYGRVKVETFQGHNTFQGRSRISSSISQLEDPELFTDLDFLREPFGTKYLRKYISCFLGFIPSCLVVGLGYIGWCGLTTIGFYACNKAKDPLLTSTLSLATFFNTMSIQSMNYASAEKAGIAMSQAYGAKDYRGVKKYFCQSLLMGLVYASVISIPLMLFTEEILLALHIMPELAKSVKGFYWKIALIDIFRLVGDLLMVFASSQGIETTFFGLMIANTLISGAFMCYLCFYVGLVLDALFYASIMYLLINIGIFIKVYVFECDEKTKGFVSIEILISDFGSFVQDWIKYFAGIWIEWMAWEISSYFAALTNDINQVAAFGSMINLAYTSITCQVGFHVVARSRINYLIANIRKYSISKYHHIGS